MMTVTQRLWCIRKVPRHAVCLFHRISSSKVHCFHLFTKKWYKGKRLCVALTEKQTLPLCLKHKDMLTLALFKEDEPRPRSNRLRLHIACKYVLEKKTLLLLSMLFVVIWAMTLQIPFRCGWSAKVFFVSQNTRNKHFLFRGAHLPPVCVTIKCEVEQNFYMQEIVNMA